MERIPLLALMIAMGSFFLVWSIVAQPRDVTYIVIFRQKANLTSLHGNRVAVKRTLIQNAQQTQAPLIAQLQRWQKGGKVKRYRSFWIVNAIALEANPEVIESLKRYPSVKAVIEAKPVHLIRPILSKTIRPRQAFTWGLEKIRVPEAWSAFGVQGANVTVGVIDTGIDPTHPDLRNKLRPTNGWFDPYDPDSSPSDWHGHGTHVSGTIAGGNTSGTQIGVAPRSTLIVAQLFDEDELPTDEEVLECMQWMIDPDGDPNTDDGADVVNNSWGYIFSHSPEMWNTIREALEVWIAANIFPAFAIGNFGPYPGTTSSPGDYPMAFGVGATDIMDNIAEFSSRGPVFWEGIGEIIKPDVSAPGVSVYSSVPGGYEYWDGTSMACPHVVGTVALAISFARAQNISLTVDTLKQLLKNGAADLGASGPDNDYGWGRIDAFKTLLPLAPDPNEPNDTPAQATPIAFGETKFGKIEPNDDVDFFKFTATKNTVITVDINGEALGSGIDVVLKLLDSDGETVLAESDDANGSKDPHIAKFVLPHTGDFYLRVASKAFSGDLRFYIISLKLRSVPNLTARFDKEENRVVLEWESVFNSLRFRSVAYRSPVIRPMDLLGYRVYRSEQAQGPYQLIAILPPDQTTYTDSNLPTNWVFLYYRVTSVYDEGESEPATARVPSEGEPNDNPATATPISYGTSRGGLIMPSGDLDFYKFEGERGDFVTLEIWAEQEGSLLNSMLTLYDTDGQTVLAVNEDFADWWPVTLDSKIVRFPLPRSGTFYLKVEDYNGEGSENHFYTLTLFKDIHDDHSDWPQNATPIAGGRSFDGTINPPPDTDYFVFEGRIGDTVSAIVGAVNQSPLSPIIALYDEQGNLLAWNSGEGWRDSAMIWDFTLPKTGLYFLRVMPYYGPEVGGRDYFYKLAFLSMRGPTISVAPTYIEQNLLQGGKVDVLVNVKNEGVKPLTFLTRGATAVLSTIRYEPSRRLVTVVPENSKLYREYLRKRRDREKMMSSYANRFHSLSPRTSIKVRRPKQTRPIPFEFTPDPNKEYTVDLIALKEGKPISTLQADHSPEGEWRWIITDPDESPAVAPQINVRNVFFQSDSGRIYFLAELVNGEFDSESNAFYISLDTDRNAGTGDPSLVPGMGVDYVIYFGLGDRGVWRYNPVTDNFEHVADLIWFKSVNGLVEIGANLADLGNPIDIHVACRFIESLVGIDPIFFEDRIPDIWYAPITRDLPWMERSPVAGSILEGESVDLTVTLDATSLGLGSHRTNLVFNSNDLANPQILVPVNLTVMQVPNFPNLVSPSDGSIVRPTPTFVVKLSDPDNDRVKAVIEVKREEEIKTFESDFVESGSEASFTVPEDQALSGGQWVWRAKAIDERGQESEYSPERSFIVNLPPTTPELVSPEDGVLVTVRPTFKMKARDIDSGDKLRFKLVVMRDRQIVAEFDQTKYVAGWDKDKYESDEVATFIPSNLSLVAGDYQWLAFAFDGKEWSESSEPRNFRVSVSVPQSLDLGIDTFGLSLRTEATRQELGLDYLPMKVWDPSERSYKNVGADEPIKPGRGYWIKVDREQLLSLSGEPQVEEFSIPLKEGWNFISNPFLQPIQWNLDVLKVRCDGEEKTLAQAQQAMWIEDYAWGWQRNPNEPNTGQYFLVYANDIIPGVVGQLEPWKAYWLYAHKDCELILPPPSRSREIKNAGQKSYGWAMRLKARVDENEGEAVLGATQGGRRLSIGLPPEPPTVISSVQVLVMRNGALLAADVQNIFSKRLEWDIVVRFKLKDGRRGMRNEKVTLTFDGVGYAPKNLSLWLLDMVTGKRTYLRTQANYQFVPQEGETERQFKVIAEVGNDRLLRIVGLRATPTRGKGLIISFSLTKPAQVVVEILTLMGRKVAILRETGIRMAGEQNLVWRGVSSDGTKVPYGAYLVRLIATDDEGRQAQATSVARVR